MMTKMIITIQIVVLVCALTIVQDSTALGPLVGILPKVKCLLTKCPPGCRVSSDGKDCCICETCDTKKCDKTTETCEMQPGNCGSIKIRCEPVATCVPKSVNVGILPNDPNSQTNPSTRWVYLKMLNRCFSIQLTGQVPKLETYDTEEECKDKNGLSANP